MIRADATALLAPRPVHPMVSVLALDHMTAVLAMMLVVMSSPAVLCANRPALLLGLALDLGITAGLHDLAATGLVVLAVMDFAAMLAVMLVHVRGVMMFFVSASHRRGSYPTV